MMLDSLLLVVLGQAEYGKWYTSGLLRNFRVMHVKRVVMWGLMLLRIVADVLIDFFGDRKLVADKVSRDIGRHS